MRKQTPSPIHSPPHRPAVAPAERVRRLVRRLVQRAPRRPRPLLTEVPRYPFAPYPRGWYALGYSADVRPGEVTTVQAFGEEWVVWRGGSGQVGVLPAACPHVGAHLGQGEVVGDSIRCPMHAFRFDATGACVETGYGTKPPPKCRSTAPRVVEYSGFVFVLYDPDGVDPDWPLPELARPEWGPMERTVFRMGTHVQDIAENTVDIGHFGPTHGYHDVAALSPTTVTPRRLRSHYVLHRDADVHGAPGKRVRVELEIELHGLGLFAIRGLTNPGGFRTLLVFASTPVTPTQLDFRVGVWVPGIDDPAAAGRVINWLPERVRRRLFAKGVLLATRLDVAQDSRLLSLKRYVERPALARGDGNFALFRSWASGFYPPEQGGVGRRSGASVDLKEVGTC